MKTIYDRISERLKGYADNIREYEIVEEGEPEYGGRFAWGMDPAEYSNAQKLKASLLNQYSGRSLEEALPGEELSTEAGICYCIKNEGAIRFEVSCPELCREIEKHLEGCENCRVVLNTTKRTIDLVHAPVEKPDLPDDVRERLFKRLNLDDYLNLKFKQ